MPDSCPRCGHEPPRGSRFCPNCGLSLEARSGETVVDEPPPGETGRTPVRLLTARPGPAALAERLAQELRRRSSALLGPVRSGATLAIETLRARSRAERDLVGPRLRLRAAAAERERLLRELGEAVYRRDDAGTEAVRAQIGALDESVAGLEAEMEGIVAGAQEQVRRAELEVQPTQIETPSQPEVPEPYPPPGEADPPRQPEVPEPYPPPGELDPPAQPDIPEPYPSPPAERGSRS